MSGCHPHNLTSALGLPSPGLCSRLLLKSEVRQSAPPAATLLLTALHPQRHVTLTGACQSEPAAAALEFPSVTLADAPVPPV